MCQNNYLGGPAAPRITTNRREQLRNRLRELEAQRNDQERRKEIVRIGKMLRECLCRTCGKSYDMAKSSAPLQGFCSAKCQHTKSKICGYTGIKSATSEYEILKQWNAVGSVYVIPEI